MTCGTWTHYRTVDCDRQPLEMNDPSRLSPDTSLNLQTRSSKKWYAESFIEPKVSMAIGNAKGMSAYFCHFLAAASSATSPHPRAAVTT